MLAKGGIFSYWRYLLLSALAFGVFCFIKYWGQQTVLKAVLGEPGNLVNEAMSSARVSPRITDRTGRITTRNFKMEDLSSKKDTLIFRFLLEGERANATVKIWTTKGASGKWEVVQSDTLFSE